MKASHTINIPHKHLHSRISYLFQAAAYLTNSELRESRRKDCELDDHSLSLNDTAPRTSGESSKIDLSSADTVNELRILHKHPTGYERRICIQAPPLARHLVSNIRGVSLKVQARLSSSLKHSICKRCDAFLVLGITSTSMVENRSRGGRKPWADVLVVTCNACNASRRFPVDSKRQCAKRCRQKETIVEDEAPDPLKQSRDQAH